MSVSLSEDIVQEVGRIAEQEGQSRSQVLAKAFELYRLKRHLSEMYRLGEIAAQRFGIETDDDVERLLG